MAFGCQVKLFSFDPVNFKAYYYIAGCASGQDETNPALCYVPARKIFPLPVSPRFSFVISL